MSLVSLSLSPEDFSGAQTAPVATGNAALDKRVVYSPHILGPSTRYDAYFTDKDFPKNLKPYWDDQYGWMRTTAKKGIIYGSVGGSAEGKDGTVQNHLTG